jgi:ppGpp synthetase/RelA/SpoT-type nucleotidyltranferase
MIVERKGVAIEVQLRTIVQDLWANTVEEQSRKHGVGFKFGAGAADIHATFVAASAVLAQFDRGELSREELLSELRKRAMMGIV